VIEDQLGSSTTACERGVSVPDIASKLVIPTDKNNGRRPSVASICRALADGEATSDKG
jgi:hypothetical protein